MIKKVILMAPLPPPHGGIAQWTKRMLECELPNDWSIEVVDEKVSTKRGNYSEKRNYLEELKRSLKIWIDLRKKLRLYNENIKVVHCCIPATPYAMLRELISCIIAKKYNTKFIIHFRCTVPNMIKSGISRKILKMLCNKADLIIALNKQSECYMSQHSKTKIEIIPNFVDLDKNKKYGEYKVNREINRMCYVGGVIKAKGAYQILKIAQIYPKIIFELIGNPTPDIKEYILKNKIENVVLTGEIEHKEVIQHMYKSDLFLFLTHYPGEGFSNALVEAMSIGLPCLVTDWAANADMIEGKGGIVVPVEDIDASIDAIEKLNKYEVRKKMSNWNKTKVGNSYEKKIVVNKYVQYYEQLVQEDKDIF